MIDLPPKPTLFIDRNSGGRVFKSLIEAAGIRIVLHDEHFKDKKTPDHVWLAEVAKLGWIMITGDKRTAKTPLLSWQLHADGAATVIDFKHKLALMRRSARCNPHDGE